MAALKCTCPACNVIFDVDQSGGAIACPMCDMAFTPAPASPPPVAPVAPEPAADAPALPFIEMPTAAPTPPRRRPVVAILAVAALILFGTGIALAFGLSSQDRPARTTTTAANDEMPSLERERELPSAPWPQLNLNKLPPTIDKTPPAPPPQPELPAPIPVPLSSQELAERVNRAIERGTINLKEHGRSMNLPAQYEGLMGLTLLECGVPRTDPVIRRIAASLRQQAKEMHKTYVLSTSIFFFDRLGMAQDRPLICTFADRLILGQSDNGTWTYYCPLNIHVPPPGLMRGRPAGPSMFPGYTTYSGPSPPPPIPMLHTKGRRLSFQGDHSNTQFAALALWIAQRHGADVRPALQLVERHFREVQSDEGSWGYHPRSGGWRTSSTCAGLLGLAVGHGIDAGGGRDARLPLRPNADGRIKAGLQFLGNSITTVRPGRWALDGRDNMYTLWSIERTAVIYNLHTIGETEWYPWAAGWLIDMQNADGSWRHNLGAQVDTCFALLVLRKSNLVPDLTLVLRNPTRKLLPAPLIAAKPAPPPNLPNDGLIDRPGTGRRFRTVAEAMSERPAGAGGRIGPDSGGVNPEDERKRLPQ